MQILELGGAQSEAPQIFRQVLPDREQQGKLRSAAAVAIINPRRQVLLMKRVDDLGGDWVMPGGKLDPGETIDKAAVREVAEESGLRLRSPRFPIASYVSPPEVSGKQHDVTILVSNYDSEVLPSPRVASRTEMIAWGWFTPQEARERAAAGQMLMMPSSLYALDRVGQYLSDSPTNQFGEAIVGGTFHDPRSKSHMLERAFDAADVVNIGLTTDNYARRLRYSEGDRALPYAERLAALRGFLYDHDVLNRTVIFPLDGIVGSKGLDPKPEAIVVRDRTLVGGTMVNRVRESRGLAPLAIIRA